MSRSVTSPNPRPAKSRSAALRIAILVRSDAISWDLCSADLGRCNSNSCMKLSFETGDVNAQAWRVACQGGPAVVAGADARGKIGLADEGRRRDSAANNFQAENEGTPNGLQHV